MLSTAVEVDIPWPTLTRRQIFPTILDLGLKWLSTFSTLEGQQLKLGSVSLPRLQSSTEHIRMVQLPSTTAELITFTLTLMTLSHMKPLQLRYKSALLKPNGLEFANFTLSPKSAKSKTAPNVTDISQPNVHNVSIQEESPQIQYSMEPASVMVFIIKNHIPANALTHALLFRFNIMVTRQQGTVKPHVRQGILL